MEIAKLDNGQYEMTGTHIMNGESEEDISSEDEEKVDHSQMNHGEMDHSEMDHSQMNHAQMNRDGKEPNTVDHSNQQQHSGDGE